jgi:hypothetical protein
VAYDVTGAAAAAVGEVIGEPVDRIHAAVVFRSERHLRIDGAAASFWDPLTGDYKTADGVVRLHCNYPAHRAAAQAVLPVHDKPAIAVETAVHDAGGAAAALRTPDEWRRHPQGRAVAAEPLIALEPLGAGRPGQPRERLRVLDLTRVIAGPVAGRTLAALGADVLRVGADHLALVPSLVVDTGFGKRFTHLDLRTRAGRETLIGLVSTADVLIQAYRPGALERLGLGPADLVAVNPALAYVSINAWGHTGPWAARRGFDSLVQLATGIAHPGVLGEPDTPLTTPLPAQVLDHATGWFAASAALEAVRRHRAEGGAWHARLSLARTARWLAGLGQVEPEPEPDPAPYLSTMDSPFGRLTYVRPPGAADYPGPPHRPGADPPVWLEP